MTKRTQRFSAQNGLELARTDPGRLYDKDYYSLSYEEGASYPYGRHEPWLSFFAKIAKRIDLNFRPKTVVDIGCAYGLLTEALVDRGIDAYGFDVSPYAISNARSDMKDRLAVHSIYDPIPLTTGKKYDLAVCIEVLEHLPPEKAEQAIANLCACSDRVLFSSSPDDFDEPTHFNVLPTDDWVKMFGKFEFKPARPGHKAPYVANQARVVENASARKASLWAGLPIGRF